MEQFHQDGKVGFFGGCVIAAFKSFTLDSFVETVVYAALGTAVSFFVSMLLRYLVGKMKSR